MTNYRQILRLYHDGFSQMSIASICSCSRNTVKKTIHRFDCAKLAWPLDENMTDLELSELLLGKNEVPDSRVMPDFEHIQKELSKSGVTLSLLWSEYLAECQKSESLPYMYSQFCELFRKYTVKNKATMHIPRTPGEVIEVDWAGDNAYIIDSVTGELIKAYIFVATLPSSRYTYVEAFLSMDLEVWITAHINAFRYFDGVARTLVIDNLKTGVQKSSAIDPLINRTYQEMADHYGTVIIPARVRKPKDKANVEGEVGIVSTWILAALRNVQCFSLKELNDEIHKKLDEYNDKPFQKRPGSRRSEFNDIEKKLLLPLPERHFVIAHWKIATVQFNYHVSVEKMNYSVPYEYLKFKVDVRLTDRTIEIFHKGNRLASHARLKGMPHQYSTLLEHMPEGHYQYAQMSSSSLKKRASLVGEYTKSVVEFMLGTSKVEQQAFKSCLGLLNLSDKFGVERLDAACRLSFSLTKHPSYKSIRLILQNGTDRMSPLPLPVESQEPDEFSLTRGSAYYGGDE